VKAQFRKIVVGIDFSDASLAGARWVSSCLAPRAELLLVHVVPVPRPPVYLHEHIGSTIDQRSTLVPRLYTALRGFAVFSAPIEFESGSEREYRGLHSRAWRTK
jgi:hypothetical protein